MDALRTREEIDRCLRCYRHWERRFLAAPTNATVRARFESTVAALCAATGERCGREAAAAAERRLRAGPRPARVVTSSAV
ncbi:DUF5133 domain-containing protein [Streptomyces sp. SID14478]|uniref:DUF5133 domain-containing protein n=1 Tax=Streptomyces sp. SID14478 TaxID=2706073 RepID=UPI0013DCC3EF|nr:DUF5133 domain-containing protein [Streptomyces sp. SID14478]NEB79084.1 DUF5133 domain-containing protein [Streptomyces sp. SID14478]